LLNKRYIKNKGKRREKERKERKGEKRICVIHTGTS